MRRILITGAATWTGGRVIQILEKRRDVSVYAVDDIPPTVPFRSEFVRLGLDRLAFARYLLDVSPTAVLHLQTVDRSSELGRAKAHEQAVLGAQALFGAIGRCPSVQNVVVKSDSAFYGANSRNPSVLREDTKPQGQQHRYQRDLADLEQYVGELAAASPSVTFTVLRFAPIFGPRVGNPISRFLTLPAVPTLLGFDPRLQLIAEDDAVAALIHALDAAVPGTFNIAAPGQIYLSRLLRLGRRPAQPLPGRAFDAALRGLARLDLSIPDHIVAMWKNGRVMDLSAMRDTFAFAPRADCRHAVLAGYERLPEPSAGPT